MFKKFLYPALFLFSTWYFYNGIAPDTFHSHYIVLTMLGGIATAALLGMTLFNFFPAKAELEGAEKKKDDNVGCFLVAGIVVFFFGYSIFLIFEDTTRVSREIQDYGVYTTGYIVDGSSYKTRKVDMTDVIIQFKSADGEEHTVTQEISAAEFERYYQNQEVPLVYSKRYPSLLEILNSDAAIAKYSKREIRNLELKDLLRLLSMQSVEEIKNHLNNVNQKWEVISNAGPNSFTFINKFKNIALNVTINKGLVYVHNDNDPGIFREELIDMGFKSSAVDESKARKGNYLLNDSFIVNKRMERTNTAPSQDMLEPGFHTVVEISRIK